MNCRGENRHRGQGFAEEGNMTTTQIETHIQYNHSYMVTDEYMAQEEDWDRDLLLDPAWEKQQRKVGGQLGRENSRSKMSALGSRPNLGLSEWDDSRRAAGSRPSWLFLLTPCCVGFTDKLAFISSGTNHKH